MAKRERGGIKDKESAVGVEETKRMKGRAGGGGQLREIPTERDAERGS